MKRYRAVRGKEAPWQTKAVKSAVHLFRGTFDIEASGTVITVWNILTVMRS